MTTISATQARNEWSTMIDSVIREKPKFIKRTRDYMFLSDIGIIENLLTAYTFHAEIFSEDDGSITLSLDEIDLVENGPNQHDTLLKLSAAILEYAKDYYEDFSYWSKGSRKLHIPYVLKALILNDPQKIGGFIQCRHGES